MLAMGPLSTQASDLPIPPNRSRLHNAEHISSDLEGSTAGVDRKNKKRIQNRVAQRTYRTRIKQRLHDLQQQVHQLQQKEGEQQCDIQPCELEAGDSGNEGATFYIPSTRTPTTMPVRPNLAVTSQDIPSIKPTGSNPWTGIPSQPNMWNSPLRGTGFLYNPFPLPTKPPLELASGTTMQPLPPTSLPLDHSDSFLYSQTYHGEPPRDILAFSRGVEDNSQHQIANPAANIFGTDEDGQICHSHGFNSPDLSPWGHKLEPRATSDDSIPARQTANIPQPSFYRDGITTTSMATTPTQWPGSGLPNPQEKVEEQFEDVLTCARRVGFDSFDTMALHYYTRNFHPASAVAQEQRLSRNRRLPELLAGLRKQSSTWSNWQRRGYQDEMLKAAGEVYRMEYTEFHKADGNSSENDSVNEVPLEDMLPNLQALLTGLVSSNPYLSQRHISEVVFRSMRLLCGLEGPQNQSAGSSRQSPR